MVHIPERIERKGEGRVIFLARKAEIAAMLEAGYPNRAVFDDCAFGAAMSYSQFNRYVAQYFGKRRTRSAKPVGAATPATTPPAATPAAASAAPIPETAPETAPKTAPAPIPPATPPAPPARQLWTGDIRKLRHDLASWRDLLDK